MKRPPKLPPGTLRSVLEVALLGAGFCIVYGMGAAMFLRLLASGVRAQGAQMGTMALPAMLIAVTLGIVAVLIVPVALYRELAKLIERTRPLEENK